MKFQAEELSLQLVDALAPLMPRIKQRDKALEDQLRRAASSIGLNCAEAAFSDPGNRRLVDSWVLYDNSDAVPVLLDWGEKR